LKEERKIKPKHKKSSYESKSRESIISLPNEETKTQKLRDFSKARSSTYKSPQDNSFSEIHMAVEEVVIPTKPLLSPSVFLSPFPTYCSPIDDHKLHESGGYDCSPEYRQVLGHARPGEGAQQTLNQMHSDKEIEDERARIGEGAPQVIPEEHERVVSHQASNFQKRSSWELPDLREGRVKAISDSDGVSYPWYGNTTETVTLVGPTNKISRFSVSMNDNFYPSVTWAVPVSDSNVPLLTRIKRDQSFTTWLVAMNTTTKEKIILQTIKWRMRVDIEVDPLQLLGQRARLVGRTQQEQPRILSRMEPIPPNALVKPNANDAQVLMWRPKRGPPLVVIPPK
ncbi:hypothetical protein MJG53_001275, partial [Ovis ammon polii x Ovis aries]